MTWLVNVVAHVCVLLISIQVFTVAPTRLSSSVVHSCPLLEQFNWDTDMPKICEAIITPNVALDEGYEMIIRGFAGMEV